MGFRKISHLEKSFEIDIHRWGERYQKIFAVPFSWKRLTTYSYKSLIKPFVEFTVIKSSMSTDGIDMLQNFSNIHF